MAQPASRRFQVSISRSWARHSPAAPPPTPGRTHCCAFASPCYAAHQHIASTDSLLVPHPIPRAKLIAGRGCRALVSWKSEILFDINASVTTSIYMFSSKISSEPQGTSTIRCTRRCVGIRRKRGSCNILSQSLPVTELPRFSAASYNRLLIPLAV